MVASEPRKMLDSDIVKNLNPASAIKDTSWIKAPKNIISISDASGLEGQFSKLSAEDGVRIDLQNRADQQMIEFRHRAAKDAAEHHLMVEFENASIADGIERTWPNVMPQEDTAFRRIALEAKP